MTPGEITAANDPLSAATLAHLLGTGDLAKLTISQRVELYLSICRDLRLNPKTRPFRFLLLNNQIQMYATKECTDQLRALHGITLTIKGQKLEGEVYIVTAAANTADRGDEDVGAVALPAEPLSKANAMMKAVTKAKRRVTLSLCGLGGMLDESELDAVGPVETFDADEEMPPAPQLATAEQRKALWKTVMRTWHDDKKRARSWLYAQFARLSPPVAEPEQLTVAGLKLITRTVQELAEQPPAADDREDDDMGFEGETEKK